MRSIECGPRQAVPLAVVKRRVAPSELASVVPQCCGLVWSALRQQGIRGGRHVALYLDNAITACIGVEAIQPFQPVGELIAFETPAGDVASAVHVGPYATLGRTHSAIAAWCDEYERRLAGPRWEVYGHWQPAWDARPEEIRTEVSYLLKPAG